MGDEPTYSRGGAETERYKAHAIENLKWASECLSSAAAWVDRSGIWHDIETPAGEAAPECVQQYIDDAKAGIAAIIKRIGDES